jgi:hypothetical protein
MRTTCGYSPSFVEGYKRGYYIQKISTLLPKNRPFSGSLPLAVPSNPSVNPPAKGNITYLQFLPFGMSPCACGWSKKTSNIFSCDPYREGWSWTNHLFGVSRWLKDIFGLDLPVLLVSLFNGHDLVNPYRIRIDMIKQGIFHRYVHTPAGFAGMEFPDIAGCIRMI